MPRSLNPKNRRTAVPKSSLYSRIMALHNIWQSLQIKGKLMLRSAQSRDLLGYALIVLTGVTGIAFGFGPMNTFLTVAHEFKGFWGNLLQCFVIIPSCGFQSILWWNAYYQPAAVALEEFFSVKTSHDTSKALKVSVLDRLQWLTAAESNTLLRKLDASGQSTKDAKLLLADYYVDHWLKNFSAGDIISDAAKGSDSAVDLIDTVVKLELYFDYRKRLTSNDKTLPGGGLVARLLHVSRWLLPRVANFLNYMTINPFGVFFAFYTALLTLTFPGVSLATLVLPTMAMPIMYALLATGYAAGFVCAFFLTRQSFKKTVNEMIDKIEDWLSQDESMTNAIYNGFKRLHKSKVSNLQRLINLRADTSWSWLTSRPLLGVILAVGCAVSVCILNYYSGIQAAMMLGDIAVLLTPGALTSAHNLMHASVVQKAFGAYSALVSVGMTSALLLNVSVAAKPQHKVDLIRKHPNEKRFYKAAILFSALGQLFCNYVNTFKPHGILSALRLVKAPCERLLQGLFGLFSLGGTVIITKLQSESADDLIELTRPYTTKPDKGTDDKSRNVKNPVNRGLFSMFTESNTWFRFNLSGINMGRIARGN